MSSSPFETVDCVVIGAGVVGLAVARALALAGREVIVVEAAEGIGTETSSRNSEVIHAGIYYPKGSLMAETCVAGRRLLYAYCAEHGVPHRNCGKLIVATNAQEAELLQSIKGRAEANGVEGMRFLSAAEAMAMEPNLQCTAALLSPATGIVDSHSYMLALQGDAEANGAMLAFFSPVERGARDRRRHRARGRRRRADEAPRPAGDQLGRPACADARAKNRRPAIRSRPDRVLRQRKLFHLGRPLALLAPDLSRPGAGRARRAHHRRSRRPGEVRAGRRMDPGHRLHGRSAPRRQVLRRRAQILAGAQGRRAAAGLCRHPAQDRAAGRAGAGLHDPGAGRSTASRD